MSSSSSAVRIGTTIRFGPSAGPAGNASGAVEPPLLVGVEDGVPEGDPDGVLVGGEDGVVDSVTGGALTCPTGGVAVVSGRTSQKPMPMAAPIRTTPPTMARIRLRREPKGPSPPLWGG